MDRSETSPFYENLPGYIRHIHPSGRAIYLIALCIVIGMLISLPLVRVPVSVTGQGIIRPELERTQIVAPFSGIVAEVYVSEGKEIPKSTRMIRFRARETTGSLQLAREKLNETTVCLDDLEKLLQDPIQVPESMRFSKEYEAYNSRLNYLEILYSKADKECRRYLGLIEDQMVSEKEYDDLCFEREKILKETEKFKSESFSNWQNAYEDFLERKTELETEIGQWEERIRQTTLYAPVSGNLVEWKGIYPGTSIRAGDVIGVMSPESGLIGEFYLPPRDIAFIYKGQTVRLRLHCFPAREWGMPEGSICDISDDILIVDGKPCFRIKCRIDHTGLSLKNGYTGQLKKGMTFQAHCLIMRRSLLQLLTDKTDKWLNPADRPV